MPHPQYDAESLCRLLVDQSSAYAMVFFDRDCRIRHWNAGAETLFGYTPEEALGKGPEFLFAPEDVRVGVPLLEIEKAEATGSAEDRRWKVRKDGSRFFADGILLALRDGDGDILGFAKVIRDATPEKQSAEARTRSEAQLRLIVDSIRDYAIYMLDPEGVIRTWSRGAELIKGYTPGEVIGHNFAMFYPAEDVARGKPQRLLHLAAELEMYEDEGPHVRKDGTSFWANVVVSAIRDSDGNLRGFVNLTHDVTERKRVADRAIFLAEASRLLTSSIDYEETLRRIARIAVMRIADWCGVDLLSEDRRSLIRVAVEHVDPDKVAYAKELQEKYPADPNAPGMIEVIRDRRTMFYPEITDEMLQMTKRDDEHLRIMRELQLHSAIITPLVAADTVIGVIVFVTAGSRRLTEHDVTIAEDIASRAAIAVQNAQLYRGAQDANRAKDDFLATVSHELRTPMTAILGWAKLLRVETDPAVIAEAVVAIERSASAQAQLIDDILDVARIRVGKLQVRFSDVNLADVVQTAVDLVRLTAEAKGVRVRVEMDRRVVLVRGDAQRLQQVVWNLLTNAVKFTPEGGRVDVVLEQDDSKARLIVQDTGPGIAPDFLPHLFERFRQAETTQRRSHGGLGLGLNISQYIVNAHGGTIRAQSEGEGKGATFIVELSLLDAPSAASSSPLGRRASDELESLEGVSVLVVEDDHDTLQFLCRALERTGANVRGASSVDEALKVLGETSVDVVVSDIAMPHKTGYDLVRELRATTAELPIIAVTASGGLGDRDRALSSGFDEYLRKPVETHALVRLIRSLVK